MRIICCATLGVLLSAPPTSSAFVNKWCTVGIPNGGKVSRKQTSPQTAARGITRSNIRPELNGFSDFLDYFREMGDAEDDMYSSADANSALPDRVLELPVKSCKLGGLRLLLSLCLMGEQNTPTKGTWKVNQSSDHLIEVYFQDNSASLSIRFLDGLIAVDRNGQNPSFEYNLQESVIMNRILDELNQVAFDGEIEPKNRLLVLENDGDLQKSRECLDFL